ncbi:hypothetical protein [Stackebrandtia soli]
MAKYVGRHRRTNTTLIATRPTGGEPNERVAQADREEVLIGR